jgi:lipopolysaccharide transport system ATP-binding protein
VEQASSDKAVIEVRDLCKMYRIYPKPVDRLTQMMTLGYVNRSQEFWAVRDISFSVGKGECFGIVGQNGSGKSTLLQMICGVLQPTSGSIAVKGRVAALLELGAGFNPEFTGLENVFMNSTILGLSDAEIHAKLPDILAFADIGDFISQPVKTYSSGMYVRLAFAIAVHIEPSILVVDEALAVGDNLFQKRCYQKIEELRNSGMTLLFVSHDQESVRTLTSRALLLDNGQEVFQGASSETLIAYRKLLHERENFYLSKLAKQPTLHIVPKIVPLEEVAPTEVSKSNESKATLLNFGDRDAEVLKVEIFGEDGEPCKVFFPGDTLKIILEVKANCDISQLNVGIRIRNKQGIKVYSWGTLNQDQHVWAGLIDKETPIFFDRFFTANERCLLELSCECRLGHGFYEVQSYVAQEGDRYFNEQRMLDWADEAAFFSVDVDRRKYFFGGICDMQMRALVCS